MSIKDIWTVLKEERGQSIYRFARNLFFIFSSLSIILIVGTILTLKNYDRIEKKTLKEIEENILATKLENIQDEIRSVTSDLMMIAESNSLRNYLSGNSSLLENLQTEFYNYSKHHEVFDQVRLLDENGMEIVRVNYNNGNPIIVQSEDLQNKNDRYYFYDSFKLNRNEVFISPLDLNVENGQIEQPIKPMIRFATPVYNNEGIKKGAVVLNYYGQNIIKYFTEANNRFIKGQLMFLNSEGYWFKGINSDYDWGFMYEDKKDITFKNIYGNVWDSISGVNHSQFENYQGLFTFRTVNPIPSQLSPRYDSSQIPKVKDNYHWKIVSFIPVNVLQQAKNERIIQAVLLLSVLLISWLLIFIRLFKNQYYRFLAQRELEKREVRLSELNATKDKLFSVIGHDLINPLNRIEGFSDLLLESVKEKDYASVEEYARIVQNSSSKATDLLSNLLQWSRSQIGGVSFNPVEYNLYDQLTETVLLLKDAAEIKSICVKVNVVDEFSILADKEMVNTILRNLISNAIKFTHQNGEIVVSANVKDSKVLISVCDNGVGMDQDQLIKLFDIEKGDTRLGTEKEKGTGLGLVLCKEFVSKHHGEIWVESEVSKGSCFKFSIPQ
ncbi:hypothetical protein DF185_02845 [Marinifilum breve]|uniref:histidine kinase n=1 Tax=Marinifilum breve TaxID=2184082 RepID=A0A2V4AG19_9BACT|nr:sensor histidine kinase [Marinifilum breve]PXY03044.1 hypothetical protein DF185_02845 [Marinifilum breve]